MARLEVKTFGVPAFFMDGEPVTLPFRRANALMYLVICLKRASRQELSSILWESLDEASASKNLRHALYTLKKRLGASVFRSPNKSVLELNPDALACDYLRFTEEGDLSAYTGPFLQNFFVKNAPAFDEWMQAARQRLLNTYLSAVYGAMRRARDAGDLDEAIRLANLSLAQDPLDERSAACLMELYGKAGRYPKAVEVFQRLKASLAAELGIAPLRETAQTYYGLLEVWNKSADAPGDASDARGAPYAGIEAALNHLSPLARQLAELIALFDEPVPCALLTELAGWEEEKLSAAGDELRARGATVEEGASIRLSGRGFYEAVNARQSYFKRKSLHARAARLLERGARAADANLYRQLARHFSLAGEEKQAVAYEVLLEDRIASRWLELLPVLADAEEAAPPKPQDLPGTLNRLALKVLALRRAFPDDSGLRILDAQIGFTNGRMRLFEGDYEEGVDAVAGAFRLAGAAGDSALQVRAARVIADYALSRHDLPRAGYWIDECGRALERAPDDAGYAALYRLRGSLFAETGSDDKSSYYLTEASDAFLRLSGGARHFLQLAAIHNRLGELSRRRSGFSEACAEFRKALYYADQTPPLAGKARFYADYGRAAYAVGDLRRAAQLFEKACQLVDTTGELAGRASIEAYCALLAFEAKDNAAAASHLKAAQACAERTADPLERGILAFAQARLCAEADETLGALLPLRLEEYCRRGIRLFPKGRGDFEAAELRRLLCHALGKSRPYAASDLYSRENLMTE